MKCVHWPDEEPKTTPKPHRTWEAVKPIYLGPAYKSSTYSTWVWLFVCTVCGFEKIKMSPAPSCKCPCQKEKRKYRRKCKCGKVFTPKKDSSRKYCSEECMIKYRSATEASEEWKSLSSTRRSGKKYTVNNEQAISLSERLIYDSKWTIRKLYLTSQRRKLKPEEQREFEEQQRWLSNDCGDLESWLAPLGKMRDAAIDELRRYALYGYKIPEKKKTFKKQKVADYRIPSVSLPQQVAQW